MNEDNHTPDILSLDGISNAWIRDVDKTEQKGEKQKNNFFEFWSDVFHIVWVILNDIFKYKL